MFRINMITTMMSKTLTVIITKALQEKTEEL